MGGGERVARRQQPYPPKLRETDASALRERAVHWALSHGLVYRPARDPPVPCPAATVTHAPVALFPTPFPERAFRQAVGLQPLFNQLVHSVSLDREFVADVMDRIAEVDSFTGHIYEIYKTVMREGVRQKINLGIHRSDYMLHLPENAAPGTEPIIQQVELNTIAASFSSLSAAAGDLHRHLASRTDYYQDNAEDTPEPRISVHGLPFNRSSFAIAKGIAKAHKLYNRENAVAVMVVQPGERNVFDQRKIEEVLWEKYRVKLIRSTLAEISASGKLSDGEGALMIGGLEASVVYYRAGYGPDDYPTEAEWNARLLVERSLAVKCPSAAYQLVGTKKIQQVLAVEGVLERFINDPSKCKSIRDSFAGMYPLNLSGAGDAAATMAMAEPKRFVMKPQREGGGNNIYGEDIPPFLEGLVKSGKSRERGAYILMDLIRPPRQRNVLLRLGESVECEVVSELGVYGLWLSEGPIIHLNEDGGHVLRTKSATSNEGGIASGFAVIDSPLLY